MIHLSLEPETPITHAKLEPCNCDRIGYCPAHGTYQPVPISEETLVASQSFHSLRSHRESSTGGGRRVERKKIGGDNY